MSKPYSNLVTFPTQRIADKDLSALIAEGVTSAGLAEFVTLASAEGETLAKPITQDKEAEAAQRFTRRLWLVRRVLAQISRSIHEADALPPSEAELSKILQGLPEELRTGWKLRGPQPGPGPVRRDDSGPLPISDFVAFSPDHTYIHRATGGIWTSTAVNARVFPVKGGKKPLAANVWLDRYDAVEQCTWTPGEPQIIENKFFIEGGVFPKRGARVFNFYIPPKIIVTKDRDVAFWLDHLKALWPDQVDHIVRWFAHRVQHPGEKMNHALVLGGVPGIGKDAVIEPLKRAVGPWNVAEISPQAVLGNFNEFVRSVVLRISEGKDLGDIDRFAFYEATKTLMAAPPDTLRCNPKFIRPYYVLNVTGVIITTNHKVGGMYLAADDRRHFVAWSTRETKDFTADYWPKYWAKLDAGGADAVAAYLRDFNLRGFDPKAPPARTQAFLEMVSAMRSDEESEMADVIDSIADARNHGKRPETLIIADLIGRASALTPRYEAFLTFMRERKNARLIILRLEQCGYRRLANPSEHAGRWVINGQRTGVYVRQDLTDREGFAAIRARKDFS
jgi:hypothetical protein